jgi:Sulfatase
VAIGGLVTNWKIAVDIHKFLFAVCSLGVVGAFSSINSSNVPIVHLEPLLLAPFLHYAWFAPVFVLLFLIETIRVIQVYYGFDQIFVSIYLLLRNIDGFPLLYLSIVSGVAITAVLALYYLYRSIPSRIVGVNVLVVISVALFYGALRFNKDLTKLNIAGSVFGHIIGQVKFSRMFHDQYQTPGGLPTRYQAHIGFQRAVKNNQGLFLIIVESMGVPTSKALAEHMYSPLLSRNLSRKYKVDLGVEESLGSTIHGELRQLCDGRLVDGLFGVRNQHCIPTMAKNLGFTTVAVHANLPTVYGRNEWYKAIGIDEFHAADTPGFPHKIEGERWGVLDDFSTLDYIYKNVPLGEGKFVYWLTVSTHMPPVPFAGSKENEFCSRTQPAGVCAHVENIRMLLDAIAEHLIKYSPNVVVVVVGDHAPPFYGLSNRSGFRDGQVPYFIVQPISVRR